MGFCVYVGLSRLWTNCNVTSFNIDIALVLSGWYVIADCDSCSAPTPHGARDVGHHWLLQVMAWCLLDIKPLLNQCGLMVNWTLRNKFQWNFTWPSEMFVSLNLINQFQNSRSICKVPIIAGLCLQFNSSALWNLVVLFNVYNLPGGYSVRFRTGMLLTARRLETLQGSKRGVETIHFVQFWWKIGVKIRHFPHFC